jgi:hypothetical protein
MTSGRTTLAEGERVLTDNGTAVVDVFAGGVELRDSLGDVMHRSWIELSTVRAIVDGHVLRSPSHYSQCGMASTTTSATSHSRS